MVNKQQIRRLFNKYEDEMQTHLITGAVTKINKRIIKATDKINDELTNEQQIKVQKLLELEHQRSALIIEEVFVFAFSIAVNLILEGLVEEDAV